MSKQSLVLVKDVMESAAKYGEDNVLTWDPLKVRDNKAKTKNSPRDCTWVPIKFKYASGKEGDLNLKFFKVVTSSAAKLPTHSSDSGKKYMNISFRSVTEEELMVGDNVPKVMENDEDQQIENDRAKAVVKEFADSTNEFDKALEIISNSYNKICKDMKNADPKTLPFSVKKDKKVERKNTVVYSVRQTHREDKDSEDKDAPPIKLEHPLTRIKLMYNSNTGYVGIDNWDNTIKGWTFKANVYNARKIDKKTNAPPLATVKVNGKSVLLDKDTTTNFITYRSVVGGIINFKEIVVSKFGLSLANQFTELYVQRNKSNIQEPAFTADEFKTLVCDGNGEDSDVEILTEDVKDVKIKEEPSSDLEDSNLEDNCEE